MRVTLKFEGVDAQDQCLNIIDPKRSETELRNMTFGLKKKKKLLLEWQN